MAYKYSAGSCAKLLALRQKKCHWIVNYSTESETYILTLGLNFICSLCWITNPQHLTTILRNPNGEM